MKWLTTIWLLAWQILKLVLFRRFRNPLMLAMLLILFLMMSGEFLASMGVPFLFWHDNVVARALGLLGVGIFIEEWVYVAFLLDNDTKNPAKQFRPPTTSQKPTLTTSAIEALQTYTRIHESAKRPLTAPDQDQLLSDERSAGKAFDITRNLHTYATFALCLFVSSLSYTWFSWEAPATRIGYTKHIEMFASAIYFPLVGAFMMFLIRKSLNVTLERDNIPSWLKNNRTLKFIYQVFMGDKSVYDFWIVGNWLSKMAEFTSPGTAGDTVIEENKSDIDKKFRLFHQIALGKNLVTTVIVILFCVWYWRRSSIHIPSLMMFVFFLFGLLSYCLLLFKDVKFACFKNWQWWFAGLSLFFILSLFVILWYLDLFQPVSSVAFIASILFTILIGFMGWLEFQSRRSWYEIVVVGLIVVAGIVLWNYKRVPEVVDMGIVAEASNTNSAANTPTEDPGIALTKVLEKAIAQESKKTDIELGTRNWRARFPREEPPILVLIANSGGGIKAQVWSMAVMCAIEKTINELTGSDFKSHVRLVTGTSGGMVGASYWVATIPKDQPYDHMDVTTSNTLAELKPEDMIFAMSEDALDDVARQLFYNDLIGLPYNMLAGDWRLPARGKALESALEKHGHAFSKPFRELGEGENAGWRPTLAFAPAVAEDGRRFLICNQEIEYTLLSKLPAGKQGVNYSLAGYSWRVNFPDSSLRLSQAARLNANFPLFVDSPKIPFNPPLRIMDAGYIDNYGLVIASQWLHHNLDWLRENTSKILLVQISASHLERIDLNAKKTSLLPFSGGFINSSFNKTLHHADMAIAKFAEKYSTERFKMLTFSYEGNAALTWYLSNQEKFSLIYPFLSNEIVKQLGGDEVDDTSTEFYDFEPVTFSKQGKFHRNVIGPEGKGFVGMVEQAKKNRDKQLRKQTRSIYENYIKMDDSRRDIRQKLIDLKQWWTEPPATE